MKLKKLWIPTLIFTLIGGCAKICDTLFNVYGDGFFLDSFWCNTIFVVSAALILIIGWILSIVDRKKPITVTPAKNIFCGIFGFIASVAIISGGIISLLSSSPNLVHCILSLTGGAVLLFESCISFTGQNGMSKVPVLGLAVPIWCCSRFILLFADYTHKSVVATEMFDILAIAALLLFLFYQSMFFAGINHSVSVRKSTVYGMVFISLGLVVAADLFIKMYMPSNAVPGIDSEIVTPTLTNILNGIGDIALCGYAFLFTKSNLKIAERSLNTAEEESQTDTPKEPVDIAKASITETDDKSQEEKTETSPENLHPVEAQPTEKESEKTD